MEKVVSKIVEKSYEAGSGSLYIPILGDISPKNWGQKMAENDIFIIITEKHRYQVKEEDYNKLKEGDDFDENLSIFA
jgi:hypothetical protein